MSTQSWVTLIACVGELAVVVLVALRAFGSSLAMPLMLLSVDLAAWNFAQLAYHRSGDIRWHLLDMALSPVGTALAFHFMLRFLGRARQLRWVLRGVYVYCGVVAGAALAGPGVAGGQEPGAVAHLELALARRPAAAVRASSSCCWSCTCAARARVEERYRTWMLLAAVVGHLAARVQRGVGRPGLRRPAPGQRRHPVVQRDPDGRRRCASGCSTGRCRRRRR